MSIGDEIDAAAKTFADAGIDAARNDAEWIAAAALGTRRSEVVGHLDAEMPDEAGERFKKMIMRRARREPLAYIVGTVVFRGLELEVGAGCLVPRPETEVTAERAILRARDGSKRPTVVDVGTGCGAIALAKRGCCFAQRCPHKLGDVCDVTTPPTIEPAPGHRIACHLPLSELRRMTPILARD